jgi:hypothetical protein
VSKTILVSFAGATDATLNHRLLLAQRETLSTLECGQIDVTMSWDRSKLVATTFYSQNRGILDLPRGAGYWLWKPFIILEALRTAGPDDVILYWDVGRVFANRFVRSMNPLVRWCREHNGCLPGVPILTHGRWTKRDCFHYMECDSERFWKARQIQATFSLWSGKAAMEFVACWLQWCRDARCLTDQPNECGLPDLAGFQEHRHDQSILTNLCIKHGVVALPRLPVPPGAWSKDINLWSKALTSATDAKAVCDYVIAEARRRSGEESQ